MNPQLSIIIPVYNEQGRILKCVADLEKHYSRFPTYNIEIIVVSNGCTDDTDSLVRMCMETNTSLRLIHSEPGKGAAVKAGMLAANAPIRFMADVDLSTPPDLWGLLIGNVRGCWSDICIASREVTGARRFNESSMRHLSGRVFNLLIQALALPGIKDTQCGFKAFSAQAAMDIFSRSQVTGWAFDVEVLYVARKLGYRIAEMPVDWYADSDSRVNLISDSMRMLRDVLAIRARYNRGEYGRNISGPISTPNR